MKKVGIIPNMERDTQLLFTQKIIKWLFTHNAQPLLAEDIAYKINNPSLSVDTKALYEEADFLIVLGGDGTILRVSRSAALYETPLMGINLGRLGYLTDAERDDAFTALEKVLIGSYSTEKRMMLEVALSGDIAIALNDVFISKDSYTTMLGMEIAVNGEIMDSYQADGLIVSTPTGSTAYNLSAGGPILKPDAEMIALTPVCPHILYNRPVVVSANDVVTVKLTESTASVLVLDGQDRHMVRPGDLITVRKSKYYTTIIKTTNRSFYDILRSKMMRSN